ncbi:MAG: hypothetical protein HW416_1098, partial [Chloroflexi bacterium]|nr:hypothetical protein [Chloroflexota bacterium]
MQYVSLTRTVALIALATVACAPVSAPRPNQAQPGTGAPAADSQPGRTLVTTIRVEPTSLASRLGQGGGATL